MRSGYNVCLLGASFFLLFLHSLYPWIIVGSDHNGSTTAPEAQTQTACMRAKRIWTMAELLRLGKMDDDSLAWNTGLSVKLL